ncbi:MAG: T9SS type A sorting domain-containing protein [Bacteroidetes bacterium]|nr:T9SS type A sorting domain-containing protein [Bacteroidota bacterium]
MSGVIYQDESPYLLSATSSTGLGIKFSVVEGNATVNGTQLIINGSGGIKVRAYQEGTEIYASAEVIATTVVPASYKVSGLITKPTNVGLGSGLVKLFYEKGGLAKSGQVTNGVYSISQVRPGRYVLQVVPTGSEDALVFPAYYNGALLNKDATVITVDGDVTVSMELPGKQVNANEAKGPGQIKGKVVGSGSGGRFIVGRIVEGVGLSDVPVYLLDTSEKVLKTVKTDKDGLFEFRELVTGSYKLALDVVGASLANTAASITLTPQNPILEVSAVIGEKDGQPVVGLEVLVITGLEGDKQELRVYPNPFREELVVEYVGKEGNPIEFRLLDMNGREVIKEEKSYSVSARYRIEVKEKDLPQGMYILEILQSNRRALLKVVRR